MLISSMKVIQLLQGAEFPATTAGEGVNNLFAIARVFDENLLTFRRESSTKLI
jgi:hypothetical protein